MKILIVEDEGTSRTLLATVLEKAGYQVFQTTDGEEGYQVAKAVRPDLIISDIVMPEMDGNQLIRRIRKSEFGKKILFVVLTSRSQMQDYFEITLILYYRCQHMNGLTVSKYSKKVNVKNDDYLL